MSSSITLSKGVQTVNLAKGTDTVSLAQATRTISLTATIAQGGAGPIGLPTDGTWGDGLATIMATNTVADAVAAVNEAAQGIVNGTYGLHTEKPAADNTYDLGDIATPLRWRKLYLGPGSLHISSLASETGTARDYSWGIVTAAGPTQGYASFNESGTGSPLFTVSPTGAVQLASNLGVTGSTTLAALSATTGSFSSTLGVTGNTTIGGTLGVTGTTTLAGLSAGTTTLGALTGTSATFSSTLGVTGTSTLGATNTGALSSTTGSFSSTLNVTGSTTLAGLSAAATTLGALTGTSATFSSTLGVTGTATLSGNATVGGTLGVTGATTLAALSATTGTFSSTLGVTGTATLSGNATVGGTLGVTGATTLAAVSGTSGTLNSLNLAPGVPGGEIKFAGNTVLENDGASVYLSPSNDSTGSVYIYTGGVQRAQFNSTGTLTLAATLAATSGTFSGTLGVTGTSTLGTTNTGAFTATTGSFSSTLGVTGATTLAGMTATTGSFSSTLGVTGATTLAGMSATTGSFSSTLGVTGTSTLADVVLGSSNALSWTSRAKLVSGADGQITLSKNDGTGATTSTGIIFGTGVSLVIGASTSRLRVMNANQSANASLECNGIIQTNTGAGLTDASGNGLTYISATQFAFSTALTHKVLTSTKTTGASITGNGTDSTTHYNNTGASGSVTYTLPAAAVGLRYTFANTAAGAGFTIVQAVGSDKISSAGTQGAAAGSLTSTQIWSAITIACITAGTWQVISSNGTWTLA